MYFSFDTSFYLLWGLVHVAPDVSQDLSEEVMSVQLLGGEGESVAGTYYSPWRFNAH